MESFFEEKRESGFSVAFKIMEALSTDKCRCGHWKADHEVRNNVSKNFKSICWACAEKLSSFSKSINLDSYHYFKFGNLEYLQKLYEQKQKVK